MACVCEVIGAERDCRWTEESHSRPKRMPVATEVSARCLRIRRGCGYAAVLATGIALRWVEIDSACTGTATPWHASLRELTWFWSALSLCQLRPPRPSSDAVFNLSHRHDPILHTSTTFIPHAILRVAIRLFRPPTLHAALH
jgi:hypothetical protein